MYSLIYVHTHTHIWICFRDKPFFWNSGAISSHLVWVGRTPLSTYPSWVPHTLVKDWTLRIRVYRLPDCKTAWLRLGMELPAFALGMKGKGTVVRQPQASLSLPSPSPTRASGEQSGILREKCKRPEAEKKKKAKINLHLFQLQELFMT